MLDDIEGTWVIECDGCGVMFPGSDKLYLLIGEVRKSGWKFGKRKTERTHYCPECDKKGVR